MNVAEIMSSDVQTCRDDDPLTTPARLMWDHDCGCVPVLDGENRLVGLITDRDICMAAYTQGRALDELRTADAMAAPVFVCAPGDAVADAGGVMRAHQLRRLPVVNEDQLVGLLSLSDLVSAASAKTGRRAKAAVSAAEVADTLGAICACRA